MRRPGLVSLLTIIRKTDWLVKIYVITVMILINTKRGGVPLRTAPAAKMVDLGEQPE